MNSNDIVSIVIYALAGGLTVSIFRYWKSKGTGIRKIKLCLLWVVAAFAVLLALGCVYVFAIDSPAPDFNFDNMVNAVWKIMQLPMFSFVYFMLFIGIIYLLRERRTRKLKELSAKPGKKKNKRLE